MKYRGRWGENWITMDRSLGWVIRFALESICASASSQMFAIILRNSKETRRAELCTLIQKLHYCLHVFEGSSRVLTSAGFELPVIAIYLANIRCEGNANKIISYRRVRSDKLGYYLLCRQVVHFEGVISTKWSGTQMAFWFTVRKISIFRRFMRKVTVDKLQQSAVN